MRLYTHIYITFKELINSQKKWLALTFDVLFPYLIFLICNISNQNYLNIKFVYVMEIPLKMMVSYFIMPLLYEIIILIGFNLLFKAIFRKSLYKNIGLSILFQIISIISFYKATVVKDPFLPEDLFLIGNAVEIARYGNLQIVPLIVIQVVINIVLLIVQGVVTSYTKYETPAKGKKRIFSFIFAIVILFVTCFCNWESILPENHVKIIQNYYRYGGVIEFLKNVHYLVEKPVLENCTVENLEKIKYEIEQSGKNIVPSGEQPNIIVIMSESFSDPTKLKGVTFNQDPIPNYRKLSGECTNGNTISDVYGGKTCMSEFEFLTASTGKFLNYEKYPYTQIVNRKMCSIPRILNDKGYETIAIHPNSGTFYNRINAYPYLGFEKLVFRSEYHQIENTYATNVSDMDTAKEIIYQYEHANSDKKFIFAVTIEAHVCFDIGKYEKYDIEIESSNYTEKTTNELKSYTQGIYHFDQSLQYLVDYFDKKKEPVMIVTFGDHLPPINDIYDSEYQNNIERYSTPYIIWTNYDNNIEDKENLSIPALAMYTMKNANISLPWDYQYIQNFYEEYPVFTQRYIIDKNGENCDLNIENEMTDNYQIIQYDLLYKRELH